MRLTIILFLLTISIKGTGQGIPDYEQIAYDFYKETILTKYPKQKIVTVWTELYKDFTRFDYPRCLDFKLITGGSLNLNSSKRDQLIVNDNKRFRIRKNLKGPYPRVFSTVSYSTKIGQHIVTITEIYKHHLITYFVEMNNSGTVINWCKGGWMG